MDLRSIALPPLIVAAIACVLNGFNAFETFSIDKKITAPRALALKTNALRPNIPSLITTISQPPQKIESTGSTAMIAPRIKPAPTIQPTTAAMEVNSTAIANKNAITMNRAPFNPNFVVDDEDENLVFVTSEVPGDDQEPLIAAPPSMAAQATPAEMSDDGEIEPAASENGGG